MMSRSTLLLSSLLLLPITGCQAEAPVPHAAGPVPQAAEPSTAEAPIPTAAPLVEATSLLGEALLRPEIENDFRILQEEFLASARADLEARPNSADALIWTGRRTAYLGRYGESLEIFSRGIAHHPEDPRFHRHRGHRHITVRRLNLAAADLIRATELLVDKSPEVEPDGLPNPRNQPTGTTHSSAWYHLGLAHYLLGDFENALAAYRECLRFSGNPDMLVATSHWLYMTLRRLGRGAEAANVLEPISADMDIIENGDYHRLLLMYRGEVSAEEILMESAGLTNAALGYGVGNWFLYNGETARGMDVFRQILDGDSWAAFGYIAAEAEVARPPV